MDLTLFYLMRHHQFFKGDSAKGKYDLIIAPNQEISHMTNECWYSVFLIPMSLGEPIGEEEMVSIVKEEKLGDFLYPLAVFADIRLVVGLDGDTPVFETISILGLLCAWCIRRWVIGRQRNILCPHAV
jgi:hypothetical protein